MRCKTAVRSIFVGSIAVLLPVAAEAQSAAPPVQPQGPQPLQVALRLAGEGKRDSAIALFEDILRQAQAGAPRAAQELVGLYASAKRLDSAYAKLSRARELRVDLSGIALRADIAPLRSDRRFRELFPDSATLADPFVEPTRIIHEWRGEAVGDEFGWIARPIGDVDDDGIADVVVSATMNPPLSSGAGKLYVYSGRSGRLLWKRQGEHGWNLGITVEGAGDVDGDGTPDVVAGAPGARMVLVLGGGEGREIHRVHGDSTDRGFGAAVAGVGDLDGDGRAEFVVGAPQADSATGRAVVFSGRDASRLHVFSGAAPGAAFGSAVAGGAGRVIAIGAPGDGASRRGRVHIFDGLTPAARHIADADSTGVALGAMFVAMAGDVDGDKVPDVFASDFPNRAKGPATGRVYVYSSVTGKTVLTMTGDGAGDTFGTSASYAGDVDGDGVADFAVGAWQHRSSAWSGGKVTVHSGSDGRVLQRITGKVPGETLGFDAVGVGDVDGDGAIDFLVTSAYSLVNGVRSGRAYIVAGVTPRP